MNLKLYTFEAVVRHVEDDDFGHDVIDITLADVTVWTDEQPSYSGCDIDIESSVGAFAERLAEALVRK